LGIGDWGLGIGDWGLGPIPNPQSPIPNPHLNSSQYSIIIIYKQIEKKIKNRIFFLRRKNQNQKKFYLINH